MYSGHSDKIFFTIFENYSYHHIYIMLLLSYTHMGGGRSFNSYFYRYVITYVEICPCHE